MFRFERWLYVVLIAVILVWPGVRQQVFVQIRQITHTTDVRVGKWPGFTTNYEESLPVPMTKLQKVAKKHALWEGLAELQTAEGAYQRATSDRASAIKSFDRALAINPNDKVSRARSFALRIGQLDFYRLEEREIDEKRFGRRLEAYPSGVSPKEAQPYVNMALAGEKLDTQNPFYDYALAYIYIGMHRDDEAIAAVNRGRRKPVFNTYYKEASLNARQLLLDAGVPSLEATTNPVSSSSQLARMRRLAVNLKSIAQKAEENGDWERGWELRLATFRIGNQLISGGQEHLTPLVGVAIQGIAVAGLPRTAEQAEQLKQPHNDRRLDAQIVLQIVRTYVAKHKPGLEGNWVIDQYAAGQEYLRLYRDMAKSYFSLYYRSERTDAHWYIGESLLMDLLIMLAILGILSLPRGIRTAEAGRSSIILGIVGALLTGGVFFLAVHLALSRLITKPTPIPGGVTWGIIAILPVMIFVSTIAVLIKRGGKSALVSMRNSARFAVVTLAVLYVGLSGVLAVERGAMERRALQSIEQGLDPKQVEILKQTGFRR